MAHGKFFVLIFCAALLFACCAQFPSAPQPGNATPSLPPANATPMQPGQPPATPPASNASQPQANATPPATPVSAFQPVHLAYDVSTSSGGMQLDYFLVEKSQCLGRPALNGFVQAFEKSNPSKKSFLKMTVYLDSGEAAYSIPMSAAGLVLESAGSRATQLDLAFLLPTILARAGKSARSSEVMNASGAVVLKDVAALSTIGDYSIARQGETSVNGLSCTNFTVTAASTIFNGRMALCLHTLQQESLQVLAHGDYGTGFAWTLASLKNETPSTAYSPECISPVSCPQIKRPTVDEFTSCSAQNKTLQIKTDAENCIYAFPCVSFEDDAATEFASIQPENCQVLRALVDAAAKCKSQDGFTRYYVDAATGCIGNVTCIAQAT